MENEISSFPSVGNEPRGIIATKSGQHLAVTHFASHTMVIYTLTGEVVRTIGKQGSEQGELSYPFGVAVDDDGRLWVADNGNSRVQCFTEDGEFVCMFSTNKSPSGIAYHSERLFVSDLSNDQITIYTTRGEKVQSFGGKGTANGQFISPYDVKIFNEIYVADTFNNRVQVFSIDGTWLHSFDGFIEYGMNGPNGIAITKDGCIIVVECDGHCVSMWTQFGHCIDKWKTTDESYPWHAACLPDGRVFVTCTANNRIVLITES